jgi:hypothetical protein
MHLEAFLARFMSNYKQVGSCCCCTQALPAACARLAWWNPFVKSYIPARPLQYIISLGMA